MPRIRLIVGAAGVALLALALTACGGSSPAPETQTVTETQTTTQQSTQQGATTAASGGTVYTEANTTVTVATGDSFTIQLPANPSTGSTWVPTIPMGYVQVSDAMLPPTDARNIVGQGTAEQWVFSADTPGTGTMAFALMPAGGSTTATRTVTFTVHAS